MKAPTTQIYSGSLDINSATLSVLQVVTAALVVGLCAHIKIPLFFTPIPLSMQTLAILLTGAFLGSRKGAASMLLYLSLGFMGLPLFVGGPASLGYLAGPSGGYLLGFVAQAYLAGLLVERKVASNKFSLFVAFLGCCAVQLGMGVFWLAQFTGWDAVLALGLYPFIAGEALKSLVTATIVRLKTAEPVSG